MTLTAAFRDDLARVRLEITDPPATADYATLERSLDQVNWTTVRGGDTVALNAGPRLDDYEFTPGVANYYRATYVDTGPITFLGVGAPASGDNAPLTPALPAGATRDALLLLFASTRDQSATVDIPDGWSLYVDGGNMRLFVRTYTPGMSPPSVTFTGGATGATTVAQVAAFHNASTDASWYYDDNLAAQNIAVHSLPLTEPDMLFVRIGWKQAVSTSTSLSGWTQIASYSAAAGNGATQAWYYTFPDADVPAGEITVAGGAAAVSESATVRFAKTGDRDATTDTASITPVLASVWLKNLQRPYLNRPLTVTDWSDITRPARSGVFEVISRTSPIAVTDVRGSRRYTLTVTAPTLADAHDLDAVLVAGEPVLLQVPDGCPFPGMYAVIGDTKQSRNSMRTRRRFFDLPLTEVAAPDSTIVGETVLWLDIPQAFATWADLVAAEPTWSDVLDRIAPPTDIVTG